MKNTILIISLISFLFFSNKNFAQSEAAVWFLTFPISPSQNAMGYTGTSLPIDDPYGFLLNPAQLGFTSQKNNFSFMLYPSKVKLWGMDQFQIKGSAINIGYNFKNLVGIPISVGFGFANPELTLNWDYPMGEDKDQYKAYSIGVGIDYHLLFSAGLTYKDIKSKLSPIYSNTLASFEAKTSSLDFGFLISVPVLKLIGEEITFNILDKKPLKPFVNISLGYSQSNIGDEIYYVDPAQADPLPRTARLGYGISTGVDIQYEDNPLRFIGIDFTVDAEDLLLKYKTEPDSLFPIIRRDGYQSFIGDINIGRNILQVKGDDKVITHAGVQFNLLESFLLKFGQMKGKDLNNKSTNGFEIRSAGLLKFLSSVTNSSVVKFVSNHFDVRYYNSNYVAGEGMETNIKGLAFYVHNLNSLF